MFSVVPYLQVLSSFLNRGLDVYSLLSCTLSFKIQDSLMAKWTIGTKPLELGDFCCFSLFYHGFCGPLSQAIKLTGRGCFFGLHSWLGRLYPENSSFAAKGHQCC